LSILIDITLVLIVAFFTWRGFKNGFIRGIFGVLAIIIAIYGANLVAKAYADDFTGVLEPFVSGVVDKAYSDVINSDEPEVQNEEQPGDTDENAESAEKAEVTEESKQKSVYDVSYETLRKIGITESAAKSIAGKVGGKIDAVGQQMSANLTDVLCSALAYIAVFTVAFILIAIIFAVIGNIINLAFTIPGLESVDRIIGLVLGILKGLLVILTLALVIRYLGLLAPEKIEQTTVLKYILNINPLADILGI
jgi:uncharacterized membrane protein required for colicin V production